MGTITVPETTFMEEASLGVDAFSSVRSMEVALREMGFPTTQLNAVGDCMKEEPMRLAAKVCLEEYRKNNEVALLMLIDKILVEWHDQEILMKPFPRFHVHYAGAHDANGMYKAVRMHNNRPMYRQCYMNRKAIMYFDEFWKINCLDSTDGWSYAAIGATGALPPEDSWTVCESPVVDGGANSEGSLEPPPKVEIMANSSSVVGSIEQDSPEFAPATAALFTAWDEDSVALRPLLSHMRGGGKLIDLKRVAAASLWRTVMQGA